LSAGGVAVNSVLSDLLTGRFIFYVDTEDYSVTQLFRVVVSCANYGSQTWDYVNCFDTNAIVVSNTQTTSYQLVLSDSGKCVYMNNAAANVVITVPPFVTVPFDTDARVDVLQLGTGTVTFLAGAGVTLYSSNNYLKLSGQYIGATLIKIATNTWVLIGDLIP
jgi:hypothetical protein